MGPYSRQMTYAPGSKNLIHHRASFMALWWTNNCGCWTILNPWLQMRSISDNLSESFRMSLVLNMRLTEVHGNEEMTETGCCDWEHIFFENQQMSACGYLLILDICPTRFCGTNSCLGLAVNLQRSLTFLCWHHPYCVDLCYAPYTGRSESLSWQLSAYWNGTFKGGTLLSLPSPFWQGFWQPGSYGSPVSPLFPHFITLSPDSNLA